MTVFVYFLILGILESPYIPRSICVQITNPNKFKKVSLLNIPYLLDGLFNFISADSRNQLNTLAITS